MLARRALLLRLWRELHLRISSTTGQQHDVTVGEHKGGIQSNSRPSDGRSMPSSTTAATVDANPQPPLYGGILPREDDGNILLLERSPQASDAGACTPWRLKPYIRLHLYISDAPCGDASIYEQKRQAPIGGGGGSARCRGGNGDRGNNSSGDGAPHSTPPAGSRSDGERWGRAGDDRGDSKRARCSVATECLSDAVVPSPRPGLPLDEERSCSAASLNPLDCRPREPEVRVGGKLAGQGENMGVETMTFTGAKIIAAVKERGAPDRSFTEYRNEEGGRSATADLVLRIDREQEQQLGALRIKSSRSNILEEGRTMSMSCSDKLAKWAFLGVQVREMVILVFIVIMRRTSQCMHAVLHCVRLLVPCSGCFFSCIPLLRSRQSPSFRATKLDERTTHLTPASLVRLRTQPLNDEHSPPLCPSLVFRTVLRTACSWWYVPPPTCSPIPPTPNQVKAGDGAIPPILQFPTHTPPIGQRHRVSR